jgi:hypothetical protein
MKARIIMFILGVVLTGCSTRNEKKIEKHMEPRILAIGRLQSTLDVLVEEWERYGRNVIASNSNEKIKEIIKSDAIDFIVIGGGLPDGRLHCNNKLRNWSSPNPQNRRKNGALQFYPFPKQPCNNA